MTPAQSLWWWTDGGFRCAFWSTSINLLPDLYSGDNNLYGNVENKLLSLHVAAVMLCDITAS